MIKDFVTQGALVGIAADILKLTVNYIAHILNFSPAVFWQLTATRFLEKKDLYKPMAYLIGGIADLTFSALLGVIFVYFIYYFGVKHLLIKGIGFGLAVWVVVFGTLLGQSVQTKLPQNPVAILVTIIAHIFFGMTLALVTGRLLKQANPNSDC